MSKRFISVFWAGSGKGGLFTNSNTPFSIASAAHAVELHHCRRGLVLNRIVLGGNNEADKPARIKETQAWIELQNPQEGDIFFVIDVNQRVRYGVITCVGEARGRYDH